MCRNLLNTTRSLLGRSARCEITLMVKLNAQRYRLKDKLDILGNMLFPFLAACLMRRLIPLMPLRQNDAMDSCRLQDVCACIFARHCGIQSSARLTAEPPDEFHLSLTFTVICWKNDTKKWLSSRTGSLVFACCGGGGRSCRDPYFVRCLPLRLQLQMKMIGT